MIDASAETITIIFIIAILGGVVTGYPIAFIVGASGFIIGYLALGPMAFELMYARVYSLLLNYTLLAVPLFIFMGIILERSGITTRLYSALYLLLGGFRGGLAISTVLFGTILAACLGVTAASVSMLTIVALTPMLQRGYEKGIATGSVCAGGNLGILIPPSVMLVIYGPTASISVGKLFMGAIFPGLMLSALYCAYIAIRSLLQPGIAPAISKEERDVPWTRKARLLLSSLLPPVILILSVLGSIFFGIAPPTEAAGIGAMAAVLLAAVYRKLNLKVLSYAALETLRITSFVLLIGGLSFATVGIFIRAGCGEVLRNAVLSAPMGRWGAFTLVMLIVIILGMFIDWIGILFIMVPIITPIAPALGFDPLWFAIMICINLQMSFLTPPFAVSIFVVRGTAPPELGVTTVDIIRGVIPFIILIVIGLALCIAFPQIILWLPGQMVVGWT